MSFVKLLIHIYGWMSKAKTEVIGVLSSYASTQQYCNNNDHYGSGLLFFWLKYGRGIKFFLSMRDVSCSSASSGKSLPAGEFIRMGCRWPSSRIGSISCSLLLVSYKNRFSTSLCSICLVFCCYASSCFPSK